MKDNKYIGITEDKLHHILGVARRCYELALEKGYNEDYARRLFLLGWLHDIGYEFSETPEEHGKVANDMISSYVKNGIYAVRNHGNANLDYTGLDLDLLNIADLTVDNKGNKCTVEERLEYIKNKYGENSEQYTGACKLAYDLKLINTSIDGKVKVRKEETILLEDTVETNSNGVNKKIKANIFSDEKMRELGFTDYAKDRWYFNRLLRPSKKSKGFEISFSISIPKDGSDIRIDVLDEAFCQPYDYQAMIINSREKKTKANETCLKVFDWVEELMKELADKGVLEGHVYGEYI